MASVLLNAFHLAAHTGDHGRKVLDIAHLAHLLDLIVVIVEIVLVAGEFLAGFAGLFFVYRLLGLFHKGDDVAHAENAVGGALGVEDVERFHLFAGTDELDGLAGDSLD